MARTDDDSWDLASSVGATATLVALARALASREPVGLVDDPFAEALVRAVGIEAFTRVLDGEVGAARHEGDIAVAGQEGAALLADAKPLIDVVAVRTRFFDDFFSAACAAGIRQAVILAAGLDSRAYRLSWPAGTTIFEIDQPDVIAFKAQVLADIGAAPAADIQTVGIDLRQDWPAALRAHGFDDSAPTAWIAEGLLIYLPPEAQERLLDDIDALSAPDSRLATEYHPDGGAGIAARASSMTAQWTQHGLDLNLGQLFYAGERRPVVDQLEYLGWTVTARPRPEMFAAYGRDFPDDAAGDSLRKSLSVNAIKKEK